VRRFVIFLGLFCLLALPLLVGAAVLVQRGTLRAEAHWELGYGFALPFALYLLLSLREIVRAKPGAGS